MRNPLGWIRAWVWKESSNLPAPEPELCGGPPGGPHTRAPRPAAAARMLVGVCVVFLQDALVHTGHLRTAACARVHSRGCPWEREEPGKRGLKGLRDSCAIDTFHRTLRTALRTELSQLNFDYSQKKKKRILRI